MASEDELSHLRRSLDTSTIECSDPLPEEGAAAEEVLPGGGPVGDNAWLEDAAAAAAAPPVPVVSEPAVGMKYIASSAPRLRER